MTLNDEENYIDVATSTSKVLAVAQMTKVFESMPGNNPSQISPLCIDIFRAPYTGWYRVHLSCSSARQEITSIDPVSGTASSGPNAAIYLDGFYLVITCRRTGKIVNVRNEYDQITGLSLNETQQTPNTPNLGKYIARASFARSGISVPIAATGYTWLKQGDLVNWNVYTYIANNNGDLMGSPNRYWGKIIINDIKPSDTRMGYGASRIYDAGSQAKSTSSGSTQSTTDTTYVGETISNVVSPSTTETRYSYLMVQYVGQGGIPGMSYRPARDPQLNKEILNTLDNNPYEGL